MSMCHPLSAISIHKDIIQYKTTRALDYLFKIQTIARKQMRLLDYYGNYLTYGLKGSGVWLIYHSNYEVSTQIIKSSLEIEHTLLSSKCLCEVSFRGPDCSLFEWSCLFESILYNFSVELSPKFDLCWCFWWPHDSLSVAHFQLWWIFQF